MEQYSEKRQYNMYILSEDTNIQQADIQQVCLSDKKGYQRELTKTFTSLFWTSRQGPLLAPQYVQIIRNE